MAGDGSRESSRPFEGPFRYSMSGLDGVYLLGGVTLHELEGYGEGVSMVDVDGLHRAICAWIPIVRRPLLGAEARYVRCHLERSPAEMAGMLGLSERELLAAEDGRDRPVPGPVDRLLRLVALDAATTADDVTHDLDRIAGAMRGPAADTVACFAIRDGTWVLDRTGTVIPRG